MSEEYIKITKFKEDVLNNIGNDKMDEAFDNLFTEFEKALYEVIDFDHKKQYEELYEYGLNKMISSIKQFEKPIAVKMPIINLNGAIQDTIDDLKKDAELFKRIE